MIIHCLSCGKSISSKFLACPYCRSEVTEMTFEVNGLEVLAKVPQKSPRFSFLQALVKR